MLSEREYHDMATILVMATSKLPFSDSDLTPEQKKILESIKGIAKQIDDLKAEE